MTLQVYNNYVGVCCRFYVVHVHRLDVINFEPTGSKVVYNYIYVHCACGGLAEPCIYNYRDEL